MTHAMTMSSGSDAVEGALKACLQYHYRRGERQRTVFIEREASYHGNSLMGLAVGGLVSRRFPYEGALPDWPKAGAARANATAEHALASVVQAIERARTHHVAAVVVEPVVGAALSGVAPPEGYVAGLRALCDQHGILMIADEVMTGFGRTGLPFACSGWPVQPDIIICGKAISAGHFPLSAILVSCEVANVLAGVGGYFENGQTNCWNPVGAAVGLAVIRRLQASSLLARTLSHDLVSEVRINGMMIGFDLAQQSERKITGKALADMALREGLILYPSQGGPATIRGEHVLLLPPLTLAVEEAARAVDSLRRACIALSNSN
jgi:adenosylmethionine-8-amino-7-oxononanoate aminotransferase